MATIKEGQYKATAEGRFTFEAIVDGTQPEEAIKNIESLLADIAKDKGIALSVSSIELE